jgi:hypothetical protein
MADPGASQSQLVAFSHCMQTHGVPNFPYPNAQGVFSGAGLDQGSPAFQAATNHCNHILPNGGQPTAGQLAQMDTQALKFSQCMRTHGIPDFPDPQVVKGGIAIRLSRSPGKVSDLDPNSPQFQAAQAKCGGPFGGPPPGAGPKSPSHGSGK